MRPILYSSDIITTRSRLQEFWGVPLDFPGETLRFSPTPLGVFRLLAWCEVGRFGCWVRVGPELFDPEDLPPELLDPQPAR